MLDSVDTVPLIYALSDFPAADSKTYQAQKNIKAFAKAGIKLVACDTNLCLGWYKALNCEYDALKAELSYVLDANPEAQILLRLHINPPYWWLRDNPDELIVYRTEDGDFEGIDNGESDRMIRGDKNKLLRVSTASKKWLNEAGERLRGFLEYIKDTPEGRALMAVQVAYGLNGEWHQIGTDVSNVMQEYFHEFLKDKYHDVDTFRKAWNDEKVTFDNAPFHPEIFTPGDDGLFRDPQKSRYIIDAQECIQTSNVNAIVHFCKIVKEVMGNAMLAGTFYGYYLYTGGDNAPIGGHLMPEVLYNAKDVVDFLCGPAPYVENRKPHAVPMQRGLLESNRLNSMLWLTEMDQAPEESLQYPYGGNPAKMDMSIAIMRRNILMTILSGEGAWFYDHRSDMTNNGVYRKIGWWDNERLMQEIADLKKLADDHHTRPYSPVADVLFVYDTKQAFVRSKCTDLQYEVFSAVLRCGVAADTIYLSDFDKCDISRYKLIVFTNAYLLTPAQRRMIREMTSGKQVIWLGAPGYCDGNKLDVNSTKETTGMAVERCGYTDGYVTNDELGAEELQDKLPEGTPRFRITDENVTVLGRFKNSDVCAAYKENQWYFASPLISQACAQPIVKRSGAHVYSEDNGISVLADGNIVLLYTNNDGVKTITLRNGKKVSKPLKAYTSWVVDAETGKDLL